MTPTVPDSLSRNLPGLVPAKSRRPTIMDRIRVRRFVELLEQGRDEVDAFWEIASDQGVGFSRLRGQTERPAEIVLRRKLAALLHRVVPDVVDSAKDIALARLGGLSDDAIRAVGEVVSGDFQDGQVARARLEAARVILGSLGVREKAAPSASASVTLSLGDGLRAMRHVAAEVRDAADGDA